MNLRRTRSLSLLIVFAAGALGLIGSTQTWFDVMLHESPDAGLPVSGAAAMPVLAPLCLAALALAAALSLAGRVLSYIVGAITLVVGATLTVLVWPIALEHPVSAVGPTISTATGIVGESAVAELISSITATAWPVVTMIPALVIALAGILILFSAHGWSSSGRRYRTDAAARSAAASDGGDQGETRLDAIDSWDDLSHGSDPTSAR